MTAATVLYLGLVTWLATTIVVDSALTAPVRRRVDRWALRRRKPATAPLAILAEHVVGRVAGRHTWRDRVAYLLNCHLCAGTWIGILIAIVAGGPFDVALGGWLLSGLLYKAIAHLVLEVVAVLHRLAEPSFGPIGHDVGGTIGHFGGTEIR